MCRGGGCRGAGLREGGPPTGCAASRSHSAEQLGQLRQVAGVLSTARTASLCPGLEATQKYQDTGQPSHGGVLINYVKAMQKHTVSPRNANGKEFHIQAAEPLLLENCPNLSEGRENQAQAQRPAETLSASIAFIYNLILKSTSLRHINLSDPVQSSLAASPSPLLFFQAGLNFPGCWRRWLPCGLQEHLPLRPVTLSYGFSINSTFSPNCPRLKLFSDR